MLPEERAREKIDRQLKKAGWDIVSREEYIPHSASAVKEALMQGNTESDYLLFVDDKAIAVVEAKREENPLAEDVQSQAEGYATHPQNWYGLWYDGLIPLVYLANGSKIYFKNLLSPEKQEEILKIVAMFGSIEGIEFDHYVTEWDFEK
jgi:type I restriction enzyme R subunit